MGTTRLSRERDKGVVDPDCRLHDVDNLYIGGSSVFPTVGFANPTFTIVSMSLRLAEHLESKLT
jgi:choline dehydrogenase-like flavoprotein